VRGRGHAIGEPVVRGRFGNGSLGFLALLVVAIACSGRSNGTRNRDGRASGAAAGQPDDVPNGGTDDSGAGEGGLSGAGGTSTGGTSTGGTSTGGGRSGAGGGGTLNASGGVSNEGGSIAGGGHAGSGEPASGAGGTRPGAPFWWGCTPETYGDGVCDCGCAIRDVDCKTDGLDECEVCNSPGSCNGAPCPGRIKTDDNRQCDPYAPLAWTCSEQSYADESSCDCGCGVADPDCAVATSAACDSCHLPGSCGEDRHDTCSTAINPTDNSGCYVPPDWYCSGGYGDGVCDCGCGVIDVDCTSSSVGACETCDGGCSGVPCPGKISPTDNTVCLPPPPGWRCDAYRYLDGALCDCGCGISDPDCTGTDVESCDNCNGNGSCSAQWCPGTIDRYDNALCYRPEPSQWWTCPASAFADGVQCDCGCGDWDLDCPNEAISSCEQCWECGPCPGRINPTNTTHCL
jgi:hypothetical protein